MANIFQKISNAYNKTNQTFQQASIIIIIVGFGALILFYINNKSTNTVTDNVYNSFSCPLTAQNKIASLDTSTLKTATELTLINNDTELYNYGLSKNQIPAIYLPKFVNISIVRPCIQDDTQVLILQYQNITHIYPKSILNYHIAVNDVIDNHSFLITYSPLSNHYQVYDRDVNKEVLTFGVSGDLYKNNELLFDTKTESLWSQLDGKALVGTLIGASLTKYPFQVMSLKQAMKSYPQAQYLSFDTGALRDYSLDPFETYATTDKQVVENISNYSDKLNYKEMILGFNDNNINYAAAVTAITDNTPELFQSDNTEFTISKVLGSYQVLDSKRKSINYDELYWFIWFDTNPDTILLTPIS
jgi:hypothetical protein